MTEPHDILAYYKRPTELLPARIIAKCKKCRGKATIPYDRERSAEDNYAAGIAKFSHRFRWGCGNTKPAVEPAAAKPAPATRELDLEAPVLTRFFKASATKEDRIMVTRCMGPRCTIRLSYPLDPTLDIASNQIAAVTAMCRRQRWDPAGWRRVWGPKGKSCTHTPPPGAAASILGPKTD